MRASFKALLAAALLFGGAAVIEPSVVSAQPYPPRPVLTGRTGVYGTAYRGRYYPPRMIGSRYYSGSRYYGGYRRAYYGPRYGYYGSRRYGYYNRYPYRRYYGRGWDGGGAVVAGLIGGLTLGALANPYYYGYGSYYPSYYRPAYYAPRCVIERRRVVNRYGHRVWRRVQVCY